MLHFTSVSVIFGHRIGFFLVFISVFVPDSSTRWHCSALSKKQVTISHGDQRDLQNKSYGSPFIILLLV